MDIWVIKFCSRVKRNAYCVGKRVREKNRGRETRQCTIQQRYIATRLYTKIESLASLYAYGAPHTTFSRERTFQSWHVMRHTRVIVIPITSREYRSVRDTFRAIVESSIKRHEWYVYGTETTIYSYTYRIQRTINFSFFMRTKRNIELAYVLNRYVLPACFYLFPPPNVLSFYSFHVQIRRRERSMFRER